RKHDFHFELRAQVYPLALKPLFQGEQPGAFDYFQFHEPARVEGDLWGQWRDPDKFGAVVRVSATNFVFRDLPVGDFSAAISFTNRFLTATQARARAGAAEVSASGVGYDLAAQTLYLTNGLSTMDPKLIIHAIGPRTEKLLSPYTFVTAPKARVNGWVEVRRGKRADMRYDLSGGPF